MPARLFSVAEGLGDFMTFQAEPSQRSTSVRCAAPLPKSPTAQASAADVARTAVRVLSEGARGFTSFQADPFQCSTSACCTVPLRKKPTAQASRAEEAATPLSPSAVAEGFGVFTT